MKYPFIPLVTAAVLTSAALLTSAVMAEDHGGRRGDRLARMQEHLQLTDEQVAQIRSIRENGGSRDEVHAVLNDTQRAQLEEHRANHRGRHGGDRHREERPED